MQLRLPEVSNILLGAVALTLFATVSFADSETKTESTKLRWVSPSRTSTPDDAAEKKSSLTMRSEKPNTSKSRSSTAQLWRSPGSKSPKKGSKPAAQKSKKATAKPSEKNPAAQSEVTSKSKTKSQDSRKESPFGKWLESEDLATGAPSKQDAVLSVEVSDRDAKESDSSADEPERTEDTPRVARRLLRGRAPAKEEPQRRFPMPTMHPTERQIDDRRRPADEPADEIPAPEVVEEESRDSSQPLQPLTRSQQRLRTKVRRVLAHYYNRPLNTRDRSPWEVMHGILAYEVHSKVLRGGPKGEPVTAVGWLCFNQPCKKRTLMYINDEHELRVRVGPALQGHRGQLLAMLAQSGVSENYPMRVEGHDLTVADLIEMEKRTCFPRSELTFKLLGLMHYLPSDAQWVNEQGMQWDLPKMVREEARQSLRDAACGGTHRLSGLTLAYKTRQKRGEPVDGAYIQAQRYVQRYKNYAYRMQNSDGSFSTEWFRGPGNENSIDRKLKTTGHILEWLLYAAEQRDLRSSRITRATNYLANIMYSNPKKDWETGPLGHAIHALLLYDRLVFSPHDESEVLPMVSKPSSNRSRSSQSQSRVRQPQKRQATSRSPRQASSYRNRR